MANYNLTQGHLVIADLLINRLDRVEQLITGPPQITELWVLHGRLERAVERDVLRAANPLSQLIVDHDQATSALKGVLAGLEANPLQSADRQDAAARLAETLFEGGTQKRRTAVARAEAARRARVASPSLAADLALFPAVGDAPSLADLVRVWVELGEDIGAAMSSESDPGEAVSKSWLVGEVRRVISRLRRSIQLELSMPNDLPPDMEFLVLGYADRVAARKPAKPVPSMVVDPQPQPQPEVIVPVPEPQPDVDVL